MTKRNKITPARMVRSGGYWIATLWLSLGMLVTGAGQLIKMKAGSGGVDMITHLGYPVYIVPILGI